MCVHAFRRRVSVVDVRVFFACARGERLLGVISIIIASAGGRQGQGPGRGRGRQARAPWRAACSARARARFPSCWLSVVSIGLCLFILYILYCFAYIYI
jgi:hypothetical protein